MEQTRECGQSVRAAPRVPARTIARPKLLERLTAWTDVSVVQGPIGSGKTTLLASWVRSLSPGVLWCEPDDGALPFSTIEQFVAAGGGALAIDLGEQIDGDQLELLGRLIDRTPALRVVVATRSARTVMEIAASCEAAVDVITPDDLLFTLEELRDADVLEDDDARRDVLRRSEGLAIAVRAETDEALGTISGARARLRRRLRTELGEHEGRYEAAVRMALLPRVDHAILESWNLPVRLIDELDAGGFAAWDGEWLRMHPFIRSALAEDAVQRVPGEERHRLIARAVRSSLIHRDPLQALREALGTDDAALATEVILSNMVELLETRDATYEVFRGVPTSRFRGYPVLTMMLVLLSNLSMDTRPRALQLFATESLFHRMQPKRGSHRERVLYRAFEAAALRMTPLSRQALPLIRRAVSDFSALNDDDALALGRMGPMLQVHLGVSAMYLGNLELARSCFDIAYARHIEAGRADMVDPLSMRAGIAALTGEIGLARRLLAEADVAVWPPGWREWTPADFFNLGMAVLAVEDGDPDAASRHLAARGPDPDLTEHWTLFGFVDARRARLAGEAEAGLVQLERLRERRKSEAVTPFGRALLDAAEAELRLSLGDAEGARRAVASAAKHNNTAHVVLARAELALQRPAAAAVHARQLLAKTLAPRTRIDAELVLVCSAVRAGHVEDADAIAERIAELVRATQMHAPLRIVPAEDRVAVRAALERAGLPESDLELVGAETLNSESTPPAVLTPREQAVLEVLADTGALDEIAERLFVSRNTVKSQLRSIYRKLDVSSRDAALTRAAALGLFQRPPA
ncbi:LuxR C-terminal-related transcriptional regulator [Microbacterium aerolatum]|uniref:LuxR C-terminal-related transcriptional regulator n=1 Tax=Microbacterium aerolatum TaxID=153731 RepID=UPI002000D1B9|nr:LuxR C-terminal-related transcriptional regulator [Microbacterium aerolatum]MCK3769752.1 LuxR C-terminal-related transcriptional regulator [Microbacterium aerolatum]